MKKLLYGFALTLAAVLVIAGCAGPGGPITSALISAGEYHAVAIKTDGSLYGWGENGNGQIEHGTTTDRHNPVEITF